jgi:aspartyl-tRNA(Asn)/glutamyl-tRNA(Gln) amidotransferase subunit C
MFSSTLDVLLPLRAIIARAFDRVSGRGYNDSTHKPEDFLTAAITPEIFDHLVELAALALDEQEAAYLRRELNGQLKAIRELEAIEVPDEIDITSHGVPYTREISAPLREDVVESCKEAQDILEQGPEVEDLYFVVPDIPHEEL